MYCQEETTSLNKELLGQSPNVIARNTKGGGTDTGSAIPKA